jgi:hypothetical protein
LRGKTATKVSNGTLDIASIPKRVLTKWRSFFVAKMALYKKKNPENQDFSTFSVRLNDYM